MITDSINWSTKDPTDLKFYAEFEKRAGLRPEVPGAMGYAAAQLLVAAIRASGDADPKKIRDRRYGICIGIGIARVAGISN